MKAYQPTSADIRKIKSNSEMLKVSGDGVFATLQGEGYTTGLPAVFLRLHFCTLKCSWCDTSYTWDEKRSEFWQEPEDWTYNDAVNRINSAWTTKFGEDNTRPEKRIVITGGEPLLQQEKIIKLLELLPDWKVEIETNGTITPLEKISKHQINCSPKLSNSGNTLVKRFKPDVLKAINSLKNSWFKFVVSSPNDLLEIDEIVKTCNLNSKKILIMPEGRTVETTSSHFNSVKNEVLKRGWTMTQRMQLQWFGDKRRT